MKKLLLASLAVVALAAPSYAADMPTKAPAAAVYNWTGFYIGGNVGYGWGDNTGDRWDSVRESGPLIFGANTYFRAGGNVLPGTDPSGIVGGAQIGYNWQISSVVFGVIADLQLSDMQDDRSASIDPPGGLVPTLQANRSEIEWFGTVRGKLGFAADNWLFYGTGGLIYGGVKSSVLFDCTGCASRIIYSGSSSETNFGWTVGAGSEVAIGGNWRLGAEYLYFDLGDTSATATRTFGTLTNTEWTARSDFSGHIVRATLSYALR